MSALCAARCLNRAKSDSEDEQVQSNGPEGRADLGVGRGATRPSPIRLMNTRSRLFVGVGEPARSLEAVPGASIRSERGGALAQTDDSAPTEGFLCSNP